MSEINLTQNSHEDWMRRALSLAKKAMFEDEVPVGAIVVFKGKIIGQGHNQCNSLNDATAHAEMLAITAASNTIGDWRLNECTMYVTKEPCPMCAQAISFARLSNVIFSAEDKKSGGVLNGPVIYNSSSCHHKPSIIRINDEGRSKKLLKKFFQNKRKNKGN